MLAQPLNPELRIFKFEKRAISYAKMVKLFIIKRW